LKCHRTIIPGPPGTGKTYRLVNFHLDNELNKLKTESQKILYISFSNAATQEARKRINELYPGSEVIVSTMHSFGTSMLKMDTRTQLLEGKAWNSFKNYSGICKDLNFENVQINNGFREYKNHYMKIIEYHRNKLVSIEDAAIELDLIDFVNMPLCKQILQDLNDYKRDYNMYEFSDMISKFIEKDMCPSLDAVFLDEAQDLSPLQWKMFFYIESRCKRSYIAGDDDQAIYSFQGASPEIFINLQGTLDPQVISRRVPRSVHRVAMSILDNLDIRRDKEWVPRDAEGSVIEDHNLEDIDFSSGEWMILTRTNEQMRYISEFLETTGYRFDCKYNDLLPPSLIQAIKIWRRLNEGFAVTGEEAKKVYEFLNVKQQHLKYGFSSGNSLDEVELVTLEELKTSHGLLVAGSWDLFTISKDQKNYIAGLIKNGDDLSKPSRIKVSTIHSVKGEESENVILFTDLEPVIYRSARKDKDTEHRLYFVGVTRTKENLYIMSRNFKHQYIIGGEII